MLKRYVELEKLIKELTAERDTIKNKYLKQFEDMSVEDMALTEGVLIEHGVKVQYVPPSVGKRVDVNKLKQDGIYENYLTESERKGHVRFTIYE